MNEQRVAAFVEYVLRPLSEDWRQILEQLASLKIGLTQETLRKMAITLGCWHVLCESIRAVSYIMVTWIICQTILKVWPLL